MTLIFFSQAKFWKLLCSKIPPRSTLLVRVVKRYWYQNPNPSVKADADNFGDFYTDFDSAAVTEVVVAMGSDHRGGCGGDAFWNWNIHPKTGIDADFDHGKGTGMKAAPTALVRSDKLTRRPQSSTFVIWRMLREKLYTLTFSSFATFSK